MIPGATTDARLPPASSKLLLRTFELHLDSASGYERHSEKTGMMSGAGVAVLGRPFVYLARGFRRIF